MMLARTGLIFLILGVAQVLSDIVPAEYRENIQNSETNALERIVSGWPAELGQFPHQVHVRMVNALGQASSCGGSLVHRSWVITAAHCSAQQITLTIRAGTVDISRLPEYLEDTREWYNFPTYNSNQPMVVQPNDISLVKLQKEVTYSFALQPIKIQSPNDAYRNYNGEVLIASGYGRTWTNGATSNTLNWVYLRGITNVDCSYIFGSQLITATAICAQYYNVTSQSICQGDSGGPLMHVANDGSLTLVGVSSFVAGGDFGCHSVHPGGFIRPGPFHPWLTQITGLDFENLDESEPTPPPTEPTTLPPTTLPPTTLPPTTLPPTTPPPIETTTAEPEPETTTTTPEPESEITTTNPEPETTTSPPQTTPEPESEESAESSESDEDDSSSEEDLKNLLKRLEVLVNVKVKMNKFKTKHKVHQVHHKKH